MLFTLMTHAVIPILSTMEASLLTLLFQCPSFVFLLFVLIFHSAVEIYLGGSAGICPQPGGIVQCCVSETHYIQVATQYG